MTKGKSHLKNIFSLSGLYNFVRGNQTFEFYDKNSDESWRKGKAWRKKTGILVPYTPK